MRLLNLAASMHAIKKKPEHGHHEVGALHSFERVARETLAIHSVRSVKRALVHVSVLDFDLELVIAVRVGPGNLAV